MDLNGKADPYVVVTYENQRYETKVGKKSPISLKSENFQNKEMVQVCKKTLEPIWEHELYINTGTENQIKMEIFDKDKIGKVTSFNRQSVNENCSCSTCPRTRRWVGQLWM